MPFELLDETNSSDERHRVYWFPRSIQEYRRTRPPRILMEVVKAMFAILDDETIELREPIKCTENALAELRRMDRERGRRMALDNKRIPKIRYSLMSTPRSKNWGCGLIANRWIECGLDACRLRFANSGLVPTSIPIHGILNSYAQDDFLDGDCLEQILLLKNAAMGKLRVPKRKREELIARQRKLLSDKRCLVLQEYDMVADLFCSVPRQDIKKQADKFFELFETDTGALATHLRENVIIYFEERPEDFKIEGYEWCKSFADLKGEARDRFKQNILDSLQRKLRLLRNAKLPVC